VSKSWILEVKKLDDDLIVEFPDDFIKEAGWETGDTLKWIDNQDGSWTLKKEIV
jgi:hypothetical protein